MNIKDIEKRAKEENDKKSGRLAAIIENPSKYVNMVQLIVTLIHIVMGSFYLGIWLKGMRRLVGGLCGIRFLMGGSYGGGSDRCGHSCAYRGDTYLHIIDLRCIIAEENGSAVSGKMGLFCINPVYYVMRLLAPFTGLVTVSVNGILRLFGMRIDDDMADVTEEEIISMVNEGHEQGVLLATEAEMITNIFEFGDKEAHDIMTHRNHVVAVGGNMPLKEAVAFMLDANNSRFPVYEENIDHIIGILHLRDAMRVHALKEDVNLPVKEIEGFYGKPYSSRKQKILMRCSR